MLRVKYRQNRATPRSDAPRISSQTKCCYKLAGGLLGIANSSTSCRGRSHGVQVQVLCPPMRMSDDHLRPTSIMLIEPGLSTPSFAQADSALGLRWRILFLASRSASGVPKGRRQEKLISDLYQHCGGGVTVRRLRFNARRS